MRTTALCLLFCAWAGTAAASTRGPGAAPRNIQIGFGSLVSGAVGNPGVGVTLVGKPFQGLPNVYAGLDTGLFIQTTPATSFLLPVMAVAYYRFPIAVAISPTLGVAVGGILGLGGSARFLDFMVMLNPGFQCTITDSLDLFFRSSLGLVGAAATFYPELGVALRF